MPKINLCQRLLLLLLKTKKGTFLPKKQTFVHNGPLNEKVSPISTILIRWESQMIQANFQRKGESKDEKRIVKKGGYPDFFLGGKIPTLITKHTLIS